MTVDCGLIAGRFSGGCRLNDVCGRFFFGKGLDATEDSEHHGEELADACLPGL